MVSIHSSVFGIELFRIREESWEMIQVRLAATAWALELSGCQCERVITLEIAPVFVIHLTQKVFNIIGNSFSVHRKQDRLDSFGFGEFIELPGPIYSG
jgi:hypothetical protein